MNGWVQLSQCSQSDPEGFQGKEATMGLASGSQPLPFGHTPDAAVDIAGLVVCCHSNSQTVFCFTIFYSCSKTTLRNFVKKMVSLRMTIPPGTSGKSRPIRLLRLNQKDGLMSMTAVTSLTSVTQKMRRRTIQVLSRTNQIQRLVSHLWQRPRYLLLLRARCTHSQADIDSHTWRLCLAC